MKKLEARRRPPFTPRRPTPPPPSPTTAPPPRPSPTPLPLPLFQAARDEKTDQRKAMWKTAHEYKEAQKTSAEKLDKAKRNLQHSMSRSQWEAVAAAKRIAAEQKIKGVHGKLIELLHVNVHCRAIPQPAQHCAFCAPSLTRFSPTT